MSTVIYLSNQRIQVVVGKKGGKKVTVTSTFADDAPDGSIINGIVMDQELFTGFLKEFWTKNHLPKKGVDLVVNSTKFMGKTIEMPVLNDEKSMDFIKREFADLTRGEENLFSYVELATSNKKMNKRYVESVGQPYVEEYVNIFESCGIKLDSIYSGEGAIISLIAKTVAKKAKTFVVEIADAMTLSTVLWVDGAFYYYNSVRCFNEQGTMEYAQDIARSVSQITQFMQAHQVESQLESVFLAGVDPMDLDLYNQGLMMMGIQLDAEIYDSAGSIASTGKGDVQKYIYAVSGLFDDGKEKNFLTQFNAIKKEKAKKPISLGIVAIVITSFIMIVTMITMILAKNTKQRQLDEINEYLESPAVMMQVSTFDMISGRNAFLNAQSTAINEITENLATYPSCSKDVVKVIDKCANGYAQIKISSFDSNSGQVAMTTYAENVDDINKFITRLMEKDIFTKVDYTGYSFDSSQNMWNVKVICTLAEAVGR